MPPLKAEEWDREERRKHVAANLVSGMNYRDIQAALKQRGHDVSLGTISNDVQILLGRLQREQIKDAEKWLLIECRRLDIAINSIWDKIQNGNLHAIDRLIALMNRRAKYLGLDAPLGLRLSDDELRDKYQNLLKELAEVTQELEAIEAEGQAGGDSAADGGAEAGLSEAADSGS